MNAQIRCQSLQSSLTHSMAGGRCFAVVCLLSLMTRWVGVRSVRKEHSFTSQLYDAHVCPPLFAKITENIFSVSIADAEASHCLCTRATRDSSKSGQSRGKGMTMSHSTEQDINCTPWSDLSPATVEERVACV